MLLVSRDTRSRQHQEEHTMQAQPYQVQDTPRAAGRRLTGNHSRAVARGLSNNHSRAVGRALYANHSRAVSAFGRA